MEDNAPLFGYMAGVPELVDEGSDSEGALEEAYSIGSMLSGDSLPGIGLQCRPGKLLDFGNAPASPMAASEWGLELGGSESSDVAGEAASAAGLGHVCPHVGGYAGGLVLDLEQILQRLLEEEGLIDGQARDDAFLPRSAHSVSQSVGALGARATSLGESSVESGSFGGDTSRSALIVSISLASETRHAEDELRLIAAQQQVQSNKEPSALGGEAAAFARGSSAHAMAAASDGRGVAISGGEQGLAWLPTVLDDDDDEGVLSVVDFGSEASPSPRSGVHAAERPSAHGRIGHLSSRSQQRQDDQDPLEQSSSTWDLAGTSRSTIFQHSARTVTGEMQDPAGDTAVGLDLELAGLLQDLELAGLLQHRALTDASIDDSLARSVQRVIQLGTVLAGERLTDEEIRALPKVRFQSAEQQSCPICLEAYSQGELLTALRCSHFFHVECLARWFRHSAQCPLCRSQCNG